ncbi:hypothetical protein RHMOL_Rhmol04G0190100 [Rhododendron molle]|uniref:Uncharacterized protein n=1 Tax=Rhododendron molle TaxID=49168 RepID=A0ACC0P223_RHOML|nr:hypothetical protein RHMOL_Rhmol04G0190100 [Rhododendron molle]
MTLWQRRKKITPRRHPGLVLGKGDRLRLRLQRAKGRLRRAVLTTENSIMRVKWKPESSNPITWAFVALFRKVCPLGLSSYLAIIEIQSLSFISTCEYLKEIGKVTQLLGLLLIVLYSDPALASDPHVPGNFKASVRFLNKVFHCNLYPRGTEHKPNRKSGELLFAFLTDVLVVDWAMFIFTQLRDFRANTLITANMHFPCMITSLCTYQGVRGWAYEKLEELSPGPFDDSFDEKSQSQTYAAKGKQANRGEYLTTMPSKKEKQGP